MSTNVVIAHRKLSSVHLEFFKSVTPAQSDNENRFPIVKNLRDKVTSKFSVTLTAISNLFSVSGSLRNADSSNVICSKEESIGFHLDYAKPAGGTRGDTFSLHRCSIKICPPVPLAGFA